MSRLHVRSPTSTDVIRDNASTRVIKLALCDVFDMVSMLGIDFVPVFFEHLASLDRIATLGRGFDSLRQGEGIMKVLFTVSLVRTPASDSRLLINASVNFSNI